MFPAGGAAGRVGKISAFVLVAAAPDLRGGKRKQGYLFNDAPAAEEDVHPSAVLHEYTARPAVRQAVTGTALLPTT